MSTNFGNYYNPEDVEASTGFEKIPLGDYPAIATECEVVDTKDGTGKIVKFKFQIIEGDQKDRVMFKNFNIINKSEKAQAIGRSELKAFAVTVGKPHATDGAELLNIPVIIAIRDQKNNPDYQEIKEINPYGVSAPSKASPSEKPGWMKK